MQTNTSINNNKLIRLKVLTSGLNNLNKSTVFKQNLIRDVYRFEKWKKDPIIRNKDISVYFKHLNKSGVKPNEIDFVCKSLFIYYNILGIQIPKNVVKSHEYNSVQMIKQVLIYIAILIAITSAIYMTIY